MRPIATLSLKPLRPKYRDFPIMVVQSGRAVHASIVASLRALYGGLPDSGSVQRYGQQRRQRPLLRTGTRWLLHHVLEHQVPPMTVLIGGDLA